MAETILREQRLTWQSKPVLREIYQDYYRRIARVSRPGRSLEIGGGSGNLKGVLPNVVSTDIVPLNWLDVSADAQALSFRDGSFANVIGVDILHHIEWPCRFLAEAQRVLTPGGRLILLEPAITPVSWLFYTLFHPEPVNLRTDPLAEGPTNPGRQPFDANQAIPTLLFGRYRDAFTRMFPMFRLVSLEWLNLLVYPLSGGFRPWCLVPRCSVQWLLRMEDWLNPLLGRLIAFRLFIALERASS
jgi:SAM-dependent methyltransferase